MHKFLTPIFVIIFSLVGSVALAGTKVRLDTNLGAITLELADDKAPQTVENFLAYANEGFYEGTIFHRVIGNFMVQGGGFSKDFKKKSTRPPIKNEADNGLKNLRGTVAMARTSDPNSATAQFFINVKDNTFLDHTAPNGRGWGYAVFATVIDGMDVVDKIRQTPTGQGGPGNQFRDVPKTPVVIEQVTVLSDSDNSNAEESDSDGSNTQSNNEVSP